SLSRVAGCTPACSAILRIEATGTSSGKSSRWRAPTWNCGVMSAKSRWMRAVRASRVSGAVLRPAFEEGLDMAGFRRVGAGMVGRVRVGVSKPQRGTAWLAANNMIILIYLLRSLLLEQQMLKLSFY